MAVSGSSEGVAVLVLLLFKDATVLLVEAPVATAAVVVVAVVKGKVLFIFLEGMAAATEDAPVKAPSLTSLV